MAHILDKLLKRLPSSLPRSGTNRAFLAMFADGDLEARDALIVAVQASRHIDTATAGILDRFASPVRLYRFVGEPDVQYRNRIKAEYSRFLSTATRDEIIGFLAGLFFIDEEDVIITENEDPSTGAYRARYYFAEISANGLFEQGITTQSEIDAIFSDAESLLDRVEAGGVRGEFKTLGTFAYRGDDSAAMGPSTGGDAGTDETGYWVQGEPAFGPDNEGGYWGGFSSGF